MPTSISVELVPRDRETLLAHAAIAAQYPQISHLNIPDLTPRTGFAPLRSVEAIALVKASFGARFTYVPHVRAGANEFQPDICGDDIALVVTGDKPLLGLEFKRDVSAVERIRRLSQRMTVMAGLDPYRASAVHELQYVAMKCSAGAQGFFTQPFFSLPNLRKWDSLLSKDLNVFYGISPVTTEASLKYWKVKNHAVFPVNFDLTLNGQVELAQRIIRFARAKERSVYLMPIRTPLAEYLKLVFA